jgi:hypothetical protein
MKNAEEMTATEIAGRCFIQQDRNMKNRRAAKKRERKRLLDSKKLHAALDLIEELTDAEKDLIRRELRK